MLGRVKCTIEPDFFYVIYGLWRSLVARRVWDAEVVGSNPASPTNVMSRDIVGLSGILCGGVI